MKAQKLFPFNSEPVQWSSRNGAPPTAGTEVDGPRFDSALAPLYFLWSIVVPRVSVCLSVCLFQRHE